MSSHRFLPVAPPPARAQSRRPIRLLRPAADTRHGDPQWTCELLARVWNDDRGDFDLQATGDTSTVTEWQLSWHCHRPDAAVLDAPAVTA